LRNVVVVVAGIDEPREPTIKALFAVSGNQCYFHLPDGRRCDEMLTHPSWKKVKAQVAHICADAEGGPRYDPDQTPEERQAFENLMLLCPNHHTHVDHLRPDLYPTETLRQMKVTAELKPPRAIEEWTDDETLERFARVALVVFRQDRGIYSDEDESPNTVSGSASARFDFQAKAAGRVDGTATPAPINLSVDLPPPTAESTGVIETVGVVDSADLRLEGQTPTVSTGDQEPVTLEVSDLVVEPTIDTVNLEVDGSATGPVQ
jgi:hypothetical protein